MRSPKELITQSFYRLLSGIVRLGLRNGVTFKEFAAISKQLYVRTAAEEYGLQGRQTNMARIALMTGLDRKEIKKVIGTIGKHYEVPAPPDRMAKILTAWHENSEYVDDNKQPLEIPIDGPAPSFEHLIKSYGGDIATVTVLREFKLSQTISESPDGSITVNKRYYVPNYQSDRKKSPELVNPEAIAQGSSMLVDHINTIFHNLYRENLDQRERLDLRATNVSVRKDAVNDFYQLIDRKGMELLEEADLWLTEHEADDPAEDCQRLGIGLYFIDGPNDSFTTDSDSE